MNVPGLTSQIAARPIIPNSVVKQNGGVLGRKFDTSPNHRKWRIKPNPKFFFKELLQMISRFIFVKIKIRVRCTVSQWKSFYSTKAQGAEWSYLTVYPVKLVVQFQRESNFKLDSRCNCTVNLTGKQYDQIGLLCSMWQRETYKSLAYLHFIFLLVLIFGWIFTKDTSIG